MKAEDSYVSMICPKNQNQMQKSSKENGLLSVLLISTILYYYFNYIDVDKMSVSQRLVLCDTQDKMFDNFISLFKILFIR